MVVLRDRRVLVLLVLVLLGSAVCVGLALTRPEPSEAGEPPVVDLRGTTAYRAADLLGPGGDALTAAVDAVPLALTYDHRRLDQSLRAARARMTRSYAATFTRTWDARVRPFAERRAAVTRAVVRGAGVVRVRDDTRAVCLVYVDQLLVQARGLRKGAGPEVLARSRVRVGLVLRGGEWRVDGLAPI